MNPTNVGAIFRSAAALNMDAILLSKGCSDPLYRRSVRVSMGTVFQIPWTFLGDDTWPADGMHRLKELGYKDSDGTWSRFIKCSCCECCCILAACEKEIKR